MCEFITLIAPTTDHSLVAELMNRHGRRAERVINCSVQAVLKDGETQYVTTNGSCDCGTVLGSMTGDAYTKDQDLAKEVRRLKRKGWSEAKISRALGDRQKANDQSPYIGPDSFELWNAVMKDFKKTLNLPYVRLMVRMYSGDVESEVFNVTRQKTPKTSPLDEALGSMRSDEVTLFSIDKTEI